MNEDQEHGDGPRFRAADLPTRAKRKTSWRQMALDELDDLGDLLDVELPGVRL
ncbi:hypothetical protein ACFV6G_00640 [Streptomyces lavendulae]|uniref:hypothetical protein n=1 Tax=Streptomyces lavendulae TaxID=1914 RepID=UPI003685AB61